MHNFRIDCAATGRAEIGGGVKNPGFRSESYAG
jgi:hypothetical protein